MSKGPNSRQDGRQNAHTYDSSHRLQLPNVTRPHSSRECRSPAETGMRETESVWEVKVEEEETQRERQREGRERGTDRGRARWFGRGAARQQVTMWHQQEVLRLT